MAVGCVRKPRLRQRKAGYQSHLFFLFFFNGPAVERIMVTPKVHPGISQWRDEGRRRDPMAGRDRSHNKISRVASERKSVVAERA